MPASADGEEVGLLDAGVSSVSPRALAALYVSHGLSAWGQRMWEFDIGLILLQLQPDSLRLVSTFGLADGGLQGLLGGAIGAYIDRCCPGSDSTSLVFQTEAAHYIMEPIPSSSVIFLHQLHEIASH